MIDIFDIFALVAFAVLIAAFLAVVIVLGMLPGLIAEKRGHPQAAVHWTVTLMPRLAHKNG